MGLIREDLQKILDNFQENDDYIVILVLLIFSGLLIMTLIGINLNPAVTHHIDKVVTVETDGHQTKYDIQKNPINISFPKS
jgi:hypothetical protein